MDRYRFVCPVCGTTQVRIRQTKEPRYCCRKNHTFDKLLDKKTGERVENRVVNE